MRPLSSLRPLAWLADAGQNNPAEVRYVPGTKFCESEMSLTRPIESAPRSFLAGNGLKRDACDHRPANIYLRPTLWLLVSLPLGAAFLSGGVESGTILMAGLIGALALYKPCSALGASTAFMVYLFVFFQKEPIVRPELPSEFYYWGAGVAIITLGLGVARLRLHPEHKGSARTKHQIRFDRAMFMIFVVSLAASGYGLARGNSFIVAARQLSGCLLLPVYYWLARSFFHTVGDIGRWLHHVSWAVVAGSVWYVAKLGFITLSENAYYREQSPLSFFAGAIGAVLFVELLQVQRVGERIRNAAGFAVCVLAVVLMGARFNAGSLAATAIVFAVLRWRKRLLAVCLLGLVLLAVIIPLGVVKFERLVEDPGVIGQIAFRFSPLELDTDTSYAGRIAQMQTAVDIIRQHPIFGAGMGAEFSWDPPDFPELFGTGPYIDNGWGFVLIKMGLVGLTVFLFLIGSFLGYALKGDTGPFQASSPDVQRCLLALLLYGLFNFTGGPTFFHFTSSGFLGTALGGLAVLAGTTARPVGLDGRRNAQS